jgi:hypothetical protein
MKTAAPAFRVPKGVSSGLLGLLFAIAPATLLLGCGSSISGFSGGGPPPPQNSTVVLLLTSTANDEPAVFGIGIDSVQLVDQAGKAVTLYTFDNQGRQPAEFMHLNGASEPLSIASVPQGIYSSAVVTTNSCAFTTISFASPGVGQPSTLITSTYAEGLCGQGTGQTTVHLPSPIMVSGSTVALSLNLQVPQSYTLTGTGANAPYTISPVFTLTQSTISPNPTNDENGKITGLDARIIAVNATGSTFQIQTISSVSLTLSAGANTVFQGLSGIAALNTGEIVNTDVAIQSDGSLLATRVEVGDSAATGDLVGPWLAYTGNPGVFIIDPSGCFLAPSEVACDSITNATNVTAFSVSGQVNNMGNLPFTPTFNASALVLGANLSTYWNGDRDPQSEPYATTVVLRPQTIDGTVTAMSTMNGFSVYTVQLASYDLIPTLQQYIPIGYPNELNPPFSVVVYADSNTQLLNSQNISTGSVLRFRGVIFDDNGRARMDCQEIMDGVTE